jgi:hypothetical protein
MADAGFVCHEILGILAAPSNEIKNTVFFSLLCCQTPMSYITQLHQETMFHEHLIQKVTVLLIIYAY